MPVHQIADEESLAKEALKIEAVVSKSSVESGSKSCGNLTDVIAPHRTYEGFHRWDPHAEWTEEEERRCVRKCDIYLLGWICLMDFCLHIDRGNLSNAMSDNLLKDLGMNTDDYNNAENVNTAAFLIASYPVQYLAKRFGFYRVLPILSMIFSTLSCAQAFMRDKTSFYIIRALCGMFEGGFGPAAVLLATYFYTNAELSTRLAWFYCTRNLAHILSSFIATGLLQMEGINGRPGWFYLFLIEGLVAFVVGFISLLYLPASPVETKGVIWRKPWFTEREEVIMRILRDDPAKGLTAQKESMKIGAIWDALTDSSMWGLYAIGLVGMIPAAPVSNYMTLNLRALGFSTFQSNLLVVLASVLGMITMLAVSTSSDWWKERTFHAMICVGWTIPNFIALILLPPHGYQWVRYTLATLIMGHPSLGPILSAWLSENTFSVEKRAVTATTHSFIIQIGSFGSAQIYQDKDKPYYYTGNKVLVSIAGLTLLIFLVQREWLRHLNRKRQRAWARMSKAEQVEYQENQEAREKDGNARLDFRLKY